MEKLFNLKCLVYEIVPYLICYTDFILKKLILLFSKDTFNSTCVRGMAFMMLQKIIQINAVLLNFLLIKESCKKCKTGEHKHTFLCMIIYF